jgi:pSer/pThr/pTyr-binding forkhead associated (FHA) protein
LPDSLLTILRLLMLAMIWLFFLRVLRLLWLGPAVATAAPAPVDAKAPTRIPEDAAPAGRATVRVITGGALKGKEFKVADEATIGRGAGCQVMLPEPMVSQLHARLFRSGKDLQVEDLGSTNGTFLNGRKIGPAAKLKKGDRIRVGPVELEVLG